MSPRSDSTLLYRAALVGGLLAVAGAATAAARHHPLALAACALIAALFLLGVRDLDRLRRASAGLRAALDPAQALPQQAEEWLARVPEGLRAAVQQRLDGGARTPLPGAALAPALTGLLVLLGMLGTFTGLLLTLGGTAQALQASSDLGALRSALGAPVQGLGLAFSASVAGVAGSAALGLMLALARRERGAVQQQLEQALVGRLRPFTRAGRREQARLRTEAEAHAAQQRLLERIGQMAETLAAQLAAQQQRFQAEQQAAQAQFHAEARSAYRELAGAVDATLRGSLSEAARQAALAWQPAAEDSLARMAAQATAVHQRVGAQVAEQLDTLARQVGGGVQSLLGDSRALLAEQLTRQLDAAQAAQQQWMDALARQQLAQRETQQAAEAERLAAWCAALQQAGQAQQAAQAQHAERLAQGSAALLDRSEAQARALLAEVGALLQAAGEAPRAALAMVAQLREQLAASQAQDRAQLAERSELMRTLGTLLAALQQAAGEQRAAIDALLAGATEQLAQAGERFAAQAEAGTARLAEAALLGASGAAELASLGEGFGAAVEGFQAATAQLAQQFSALEGQLAGVATRSDEQLAYYVAQARELIELCLGGQQQVLDALRRQEALSHG